jgi:S1-C subfamily serine protease
LLSAASPEFFLDHLGAPMALLRAPVAFVWVLALFTATVCEAQVRIWTDVTGKHYVEAKLVGVDSTQVTLEKKDGKRIVIPLAKLSPADQVFATGGPNATTGGDKAAAPGGAANFDELQALISQQRKAVVVGSILEGFLAADEVPLSEKARAQAALQEWQPLAARDALRVGKNWVTPDEYQKMKADEKRLIKEAHRLIDIKSDQLAKEKFLEASDANPQEVRADFYLGLLNALVAHYPLDAQRHFSECVRRLATDEDLLVGPRKANLVAALNNLAIIQVRQGKYNQAVGSWRRAIRLEPYAPELVQNLGRMAKLAQLGVVRIGKPIRDAAGELYAGVTVQFSLGRFDDKVGWLYIPYIDTLDGSMDSEGDEELIPVGWCTGFSVGGNLLVTSRFLVTDADSVAIQGGGPTFSSLKGKVVSLSDQSNLALVRVDGLEGKALPLNKAMPRPAQDVTILGFGQPGLGGGNMQSRVATILNPPVLYQRLAGIVHKQVDATTRVSAPIYSTYAFRNKIVHDAITNAGLEGAPLIDANGTVVGVHIGNRPEFGKFGSKSSFAEPIEWVLPFLLAAASDLDVRDIPYDPSKTVSPSDVEGIGDGSIFQLVSQRRAPRLEWSHRIEELHRLQKQSSWSSYEDNTCMACNGKGQIECPVRLCARGKIPKQIQVEVARNSVTDAPIYATRTVREKCTTCGGDGFVDCPYCD